MGGEAVFFWGLEGGEACLIDDEAGLSDGVGSTDALSSVACDGV